MVGPLLQAGYDRLWPRSDFRSNPGHFLDMMEEIWQVGIPVIGIMPSMDEYGNGEYINLDAVERDLTPIYSSPRFQQLAKAIFIAWEPDYSHAEWVKALRYALRVFPNAKIYIHFPSGHGAPGLGRELARRYPKDHPLEGQLLPGEPNAERPFLNEGEMWDGIHDPNRPGGLKPSIAAMIDGFLMQDTYAFLGDTDNARTPEEQVIYDTGDFLRRFQDGYNGWPTYSRTLTRPVDLITVEWGSYALFSGGPGRFGTFANAARESRKMGDTLLSMFPALAGIGDGANLSCPGRIH